MRMFLFLFTILIIFSYFIFNTTEKPSMISSTKKTPSQSVARQLSAIKMGNSNRNLHPVNLPNSPNLPNLPNLNDNEETTEIKNLRGFIYDDKDGTATVMNDPNSTVSLYFKNEDCTGSSINIGTTNSDGFLNFDLPQEKKETTHSIEIVSSNSDEEGEHTSCMPVIIPAAPSDNISEADPVS